MNGCIAQETVNKRARTDAAAFIAEEEARYEDSVCAVARQLAAADGERQLVMLCGPSSVGKTTTAKKLCAYLREQGLPACVVSLDNFYRGLGLAPQLPDGSFDYEALEALDVPLLQRCLRELRIDGKTQLPVFDFTVGRPREKREPFVLPRGGVVIFEGIHAFTPSVNAELGGQAKRVFVNTESRFVSGDTVLLARRDIRLMRRLLRDERFRSSGFENTLHMWRQVVRGDERYIFPYRDTADYTVDTAIGYEPCVLAAELLPRLQELNGTVYEEKAAALQAALIRFVPLAGTVVPAGSVLREFLG